MSSDDKFTEVEFAAIERHCSVLIGGCSGSLDSLLAIPKDKRTDMIAGQIVYWRHAIAALKWAIATANQKRENVDRSEPGSV